MIIGDNLDLDNRSLKKLLLEVNKVKIISNKFIFESNEYRFYVDESKIVKYAYVFSI